MGQLDIANKTKLSSKSYRVTVEFQVNVTAPHMIDAEGQGWSARLRINGSSEAEPVNVEVVRIGEY
jgi:hypothetical protein